MAFPSETKVFACLENPTASLKWWDFLFHHLLARPRKGKHIIGLDITQRPVYEDDDPNETQEIEID